MFMINVKNKNNISKVIFDGLTDASDKSKNDYFWFKKSIPIIRPGQCYRTSIG